MTPPTLNDQEGMMGEFPQILTGCTERVTRDKLPHASKELGKTTIEQCHADYDIWDGNVARLYVVKGQNQSRRCKSKQSTTWSMSSQAQRQKPRQWKVTYRGPGFAIWVRRWEVMPVSFSMSDMSKFLIRNVGFW
jgi:hypothetical protein